MNDTEQVRYIYTYALSGYELNSIFSLDHIITYLIGAFSAIIPIAIASRPKSRKLDDISFYYDYDTAEVVKTETYRLENLHRFSKAITVCKIHKNEKHELFGFQNDISEKQIPSVFVDTPERGDFRKIKINNKHYLIYSDIERVKLVRYWTDKNVKSKINVNKQVDEIRIVNQSEYEILNYTFEVEESQVESLKKDKSHVESVFQKDTKWYAEIKSLPARKNNQDGSITLILS